MISIVNASVVLLLLAPLNASAFFGPKSFEECMAKEMKGRDIKQMDIVKNLCYKKFPVLKSLIDKTPKVVVYCTFADGTRIELIGTEKTLGAFNITRRTKDYIEGEQELVFDKSSARLSLDLENGVGSISNVNNNKQSFVLSCYEK